MKNFILLGIFNYQNPIRSSGKKFRTMLYLKNQLLASGLLFAFVEFLDFLTVRAMINLWYI